MFYGLLILLVVVLVLGIVWMGKWDYEFIGFIFATVCGIALFFIFIAWPVYYISTNVFINAEYPALVEAIENSRLGKTNEIERAALTVKIMETNTTIARLQYWNQTILNPFYPDKIMELEFLE